MGPDCLDSNYLKVDLKKKNHKITLKSDLLLKGPMRKDTR